MPRPIKGCETVEKVRTIVLAKSVFADNDQDAQMLREHLNEKGVLLVNVMSSPGAGKTTTLISLIQRLKSKFRVGVMEADIDSNVDAVTVAEKTHCPSIQLHTGGMCHLDADMTRQGLQGLGAENFDLIFLENVGNLVCPAEYDTGAQLNMTILSVPEGDDKPLKYPLIYEKCGLVLINKMDTLAYFDFDLERCKESIRARNPKAEIIPISAKTGENLDSVAHYFQRAIDNLKEDVKCQNRTTKS